MRDNVTPKCFSPDIFFRCYGNLVYIERYNFVFYEKGNNTKYYVNNVEESKEICYICPSDDIEKCYNR